MTAYHATFAVIACILVSVCVLLIGLASLHWAGDLSLTLTALLLAGLMGHSLRALDPRRARPDRTRVDGRP